MMMMNMLRMAPTVRLLRIVRVLRIMKVTNIGKVSEDLCVQYDQSWLVLSLAVLETLVGILMASHIIGCLWYFPLAWALPT